MDSKAGENDIGLNKNKAACDVEALNKAACDVAALKKCLEENKGNRQKCQDQIEAFRSSCVVRRPNSYSLSPRPNLSNSAVTEL